MSNHRSPARRARSALAGAACALAGAACDAQVDADHQGAALAELSGIVRNTRTLPTGDAEVVALWTSDGADPVGDQVALAKIAVEGSFPARFTLRIFEPPPAFVLSDFPGALMGVAVLIAGLEGTNYLDEQSRAGFLGLDTEHLLVYLPDGAPAGSFASYLLHGTASPGFHLYGVRRLSEAQRAEREACVAALDPDPFDDEEPSYQEVYTACGGQPQFDDLVPLETNLGTELQIELVDDLRTITPPNWM